MANKRKKDCEDIERQREIWRKRYARENRQCGEAVRKQLQAARLVACKRNDAPSEPLRSKEDYSLAITDLLANIRHLCDMKGLDFALLDGDAYEHYTQEVVQGQTGITQ